MDGWFLLQAGGKGRAVACLTGYYKTQPEREREKKSASLAEFVRILAYLTGQITVGLIPVLLHLQSTPSSRRRVVLSAALKGANWRTSWQLSLVTEAEATQCSSSERTGFRGCQMCSALSSTPTKRDHLIEMWAAADISVFPRLSPISFSFLSQSLTV